MSGAVRRFIKSVVPVGVIEWRNRRVKRHLVGKTPEQVFTQYFEKRFWNSPESVSGTGSELRATEAIRAWLPELFSGLGVRTVLDVPCGDFHWMQHVDLSGVQYIGGDIVPALIDQNRERFPGRDFRVVNLLTDELPRADLILCRDVLIHFSFSDAKKAIENMRRSGARHLLSNTYPLHRRNHDIVTGAARAINLTLPPYNFPEPAESRAEEKGDLNAYETADKTIALWRIAELP